MLLKLRETIMDSGEKSSVTVPRGISAHPNNKLWALLLLGAAIAFVIGLVMIIPKEQPQTTTLE